MYSNFKTVLLIRDIFVIYAIRYFFGLKCNELLSIYKRGIFSRLLRLILESY